MSKVDSRDKRKELADLLNVVTGEVKPVLKANK